MSKSKIKHKKTMKRAALSVMIFLISFTLLSAVISMCVFSSMFGRYDESSNPVFLTYSDIDNSKYPRTETNFQSGANNLKGYIYPASKKSSGTVVVVNGFHCNSDRHLPEIMYFVDNGWSVFTFDGTGVGKSEGENQVGLSQSRLDTSAAVKYVSSLTSKPIVLYGHSEGGYAAVTSLNDENRISAVVSVSAFNSPLELMHYHSRQVAGIFADIEYPFMYMHNFLLFNQYANQQAIDAINSTKVPVAIFQGSDDTTVPLDISIASHKNEFKNPNAVCFEISSSNRSNHSTIWLSDSAAEYTLKYRENPFPNVDKKKANELDTDFMKYVLDFYNKAAD